MLKMLQNEGIIQEYRLGETWIMSTGGPVLERQMLKTKRKYQNVKLTQKGIHAEELHFSLQGKK